jgi:putative methionine-R-sulfoxide reductase with GAF domain
MPFPPTKSSGFPGLDIRAPRDYAALARKVSVDIASETFKPDRRRRMEIFADALWEALAPTGMSWGGFYLHEGGDELWLGPRRNKPACTPIGMHGACGQAFLGGKALVVRDVKDLGENYVACDPADQSEVVVPLFDADSGDCWGVLDLDSHEIGAFDDADVAGLERALRAAGLTK